MWFVFNIGQSMKKEHYFMWTYSSQCIPLPNVQVKNCLTWAALRGCSSGGLLTLYTALNILSAFFAFLFTCLFWYKHTALQQKYCQGKFFLVKPLKFNRKLLSDHILQSNNCTAERSMLIMSQIERVFKILVAKYIF